MPDVNEYKFELDGEQYATNDAILTGRDIRAHAGLNPASDYQLIQIREATSRSVGLEEKIDLEDKARPVFRSFRGDRVFSFTINERGFEWGAPEISANDIRLYANVPDDHELVLDSSGDRSIEDDGFVRLNPKGVERILSRQPHQICIVVNTREILVDPGKLTFWEVVKLAFPKAQQDANTAYTVSFRKGHGGAPEGTLIDGEAVKLRKRMIFNVSETDKS
ncbi:multiubiquitin domain-containing protein [uncultured Roseibium sp.]|uniref:multiubiquitin domain-containing protein n=1 Tax=uncultured Roseibium sp. TaxID=1936171 RepID=UPI002618DC02|nr:multiubiquitin domain-containing protein [uncultured Roseibium sp.]